MRYFSSSLSCLVTHGCKVWHLSPTSVSFFCVCWLACFDKAALLLGWIASASPAPQRWILVTLSETDTQLSLSLLVSFLFLSLLLLFLPQGPEVQDLLPCFTVPVKQADLCHAWSSAAYEQWQFDTSCWVECHEWLGLLGSHSCHPSEAVSQRGHNWCLLLHLWKGCWKAFSQ